MSEEIKKAEVEENADEKANEVEELRKSIAELEAQNKNLKATLSERNSEAAQRRREAEEWERKYNSTLSEEQQKEAERQKLAEESARELAELKRESAINKYKSKYLAMGYSEELAQSSAEAKVDGNDDVLFKNEAEFVKNSKETLKADLLKTQPTIQHGEPPTPKFKTREEIMKIEDTTERQAAWAEYLKHERK